jgi:hypothetical protein
MAEQFKGTEMDDDKLKEFSNQYCDVYPGNQMIDLFLYLKDVRDNAYAIGYRHGHEDKVRGL